MSGQLAERATRQMRQVSTVHIRTGTLTVFGSGDSPRGWPSPHSDGNWAAVRARAASGMIHAGGAGAGDGPDKFVGENVAWPAPAKQMANGAVMIGAGRRPSIAMPRVLKDNRDPGAAMPPP